MGGGGVNPLVDTQGSAGIYKQSMGTRNRVEIGLSYRPARLHRLAKSIRIIQLESIPGLLKSFKIRAQSHMVRCNQGPL